MKRYVFVVALMVMLARPAHTTQIVVGTSEDKLFQQIRETKDFEHQLQLISDFEKQFPSSPVLTDVYLIAIEVFRQKGDRSQIIEYGEKALKTDESNVTAMMVLARNYAIEGKELDRAVELGERAVDRINELKEEPAPASQTPEAWNTYLQATEVSAKGILQFAKSMKIRPDLN
jgi:hypothetical protein